MNNLKNYWLSHKLKNPKIHLGIMTTNEVRFTRKFRWTYTWLDNETKEEIAKARFVKLDSRPNVNFEETEINFLSNKTWIPGKAKWKPLESITVTYFEGMEDLYDQFEYLRSEPKKHEGLLQLWDGCGGLIESWTLKNAFPSCINGDLDYVDITIKYLELHYKAGNDEN